jgi:hypothetical protein
MMPRRKQCTDGPRETENPDLIQAIADHGDDPFVVFPK